jgi:hypothetical protein
MHAKGTNSPGSFTFSHRAAMILSDNPRNQKLQGGSPRPPTTSDGTLLPSSIYLSEDAQSPSAAQGTIESDVNDRKAHVRIETYGRLFD